MLRKPDVSGISGSKPLDVLLVDGDLVFLARLRDLLLESCGTRTRVKLAFSLEEAEQELRAGRVDVCLADYSLVASGGFDLLKVGQGLSFQPAFILMAERARKDWVYSGLSRGAHDCLRKERMDGFEVMKSIAFAVYHRGREQELTAAALRDPLTGLGNRALFMEQAEVLLEQARRNKEQLALIFMDVDGLKQVNDAHGHLIGDQLLAQVAGRLKASMRRSDVLARLGGDEFAALLPRPGAQGTVGQVMASLTDQVVKSPFVLDDCQVRVGLSCGAALYPDEGTDFETLLAAADQRMYAEKRKRKSTGDRSQSWFTGRHPV